MGKSIVFIIDLGKKKGTGHLIRAGWLSEYFRKKGYKSTIISRYFPGKFRLSFDTCIIIKDQKELFFNLKSLKGSILFFDIPPNPIKTRYTYNNLLKLYKGIHNKFGDSFLYASFDDLEILNNIENLYTFCYQTPNRYIRGTHFAGLDYTPLSNNTMGKKPGKKGLMVFFGGSDPADHTATVLKYIISNKINYKDNIYIIIGYYNNLNMSIKSKNIEIIKNPKDWTCFIPCINKGIISGGLLKFDLLYHKIPMLIIPQNSLELKTAKKISCLKGISYIKRPGHKKINAFLDDNTPPYTLDTDMKKGINKIFHILDNIY